MSISICYERYKLREFIVSYICCICFFSISFFLGMKFGIKIEITFIFGYLFKAFFELFFDLIIDFIYSLKRFFLHEK